jgi:hypothetical protein
VKVRIEGHHLPGRRFMSDGHPLTNVHVGVQVRRDPEGLVPGDAARASWDLDVRVEPSDADELDFKGPGVHGKRGERFVYLTWGEVGADGSFAMFRRAKLMLGRVDPQLVQAAEETGRPLVARVDLTDDLGCPRCARVDPPALTWHTSVA